MRVDRGMSKFAFLLEIEGVVLVECHCVELIFVLTVWLQALD